MAVAWALNIEPPVVKKDPAVLSAALDNGQVTLSWTSEGTLEEAASVTGPWTASADQDNPRTIDPEGTRFYRVTSP